MTVDVPELYATAEKVLRGSALRTLVVSSLAEMLPTFKGLAMRVLGRKKIARVSHDESVLGWREFLA